MNVHDLRKAYLDFFAEQGHVIVPSASLLPENDPSTLFTGSGMQPMVPYLLGEPHPSGRRVADAQKCFRAGDIEEVGDNRHTTFFEMLGNWSFGDYFKREQITWMYTFLIQRVGLDPKRLYVTVFRGSEALGISRDDEAVQVWQEMFQGSGIEAKAVDFSETQGMQDGRIFFYDEKKNWWSRSGVPSKMPVGEPGGPDTEMFWDFGADLRLHEVSAWKDEPCHVNCDCGRFMEIGNNVFMEYRKTEQGFEKLAQKNVDFGGGLERLMAAKINTPDVFQTNAFEGIIGAIEKRSHKTYGTNREETRAMRIIADHVRAATFIIGDPRGVGPSNVGQGYVVRRLLRRAMRECRRIGIEDECLVDLSKIVLETFGEHYTELREQAAHIADELLREERKFAQTLEKGLKEFERRYEATKMITGEDAFILFSTYGFPLELTQELVVERGGVLDVETFQSEFRKHQDLSRSASAGAFKGGLADHSVETTRLHTATHLLHMALRQVLGDHVQQKGSNITAERLRFDFSHQEKMTPEQIQKVEDIVNDVIKRDLPVHFEVMNMEQAKASGALGYFEDKYAKLEGNLKVYIVGDDAKGYFSKEICGGPHVEHTGELGSFKIQKEEAVSAGVRRIKATVQP